MSTKKYKTLACDLLIIGGGGAGIIAALEASKNQELKVMIISKGPVGQSGLTPTANGGTHAAGTPEEVFKEMVTAGRFLSDQNLVEHLVDNMKGCLNALADQGIPVQQLSSKSILVPSVATLEILRKTVLNKLNVQLMEDILVINLIAANGRISGATAIDLCTGKFIVIRCGAILIATGGLVGELYPHSSNNPFGIRTSASGTGHIMAYHVGAQLIDLEMIQFVPVPSQQRNLHIRYFPEFWAGPFLNGKGNIITENTNIYTGGSYSYAFVQKLAKLIDEDNESVYVDHRGFPEPHYPVKEWRARKKLIELLGIDPRQNKIEITIGSHFCMGGIRANEKTETSVSGLYVAGEVMGGIHGALRLSGCSFTQMIVFGFEAGKQISEYVKKHLVPVPITDNQIAPDIERVLQFLKQKDNPISISNLYKRLQQVMVNNVFVFREKKGLTSALSQIKDINNEISRVYVPGGRKFNLDWMRAIEFSLMVEAADLVVRSALEREESRGAHYRTDFPQEDNKKWLKHTALMLDNGKPRISFPPVIMDRMRWKEVL